MRNMRFYLIIGIAVSILAVSLSGCAVGIKPRSYDAPPESDVYYEESTYDSYYDTVPRSSSRRYYDPGYDPWTMGTYYQHYSGPSHSSADSGGSGTSSIRSESERPADKSRNATSTIETRAPASSDTPSLKRSRTDLQERVKTSTHISDSARRKVKRDREPSITPSKSEQDNSTDTKQRRVRSQQSSQESPPQETESKTEEEDEETKNKKSPR